jgi:hypothetical protein
VSKLPWFEILVPKGVQFKPDSLNLNFIKISAQIIKKDFKISAK